MFCLHTAGLALGLEHWGHFVLCASTAEELEGVLHLSQPNQTKYCEHHSTLIEPCFSYINSHSSFVSSSQAITDWKLLLVLVGFILFDVVLLTIFTAVPQTRLNAQFNYVSICEGC